MARTLPAFTLNVRAFIDQKCGPAPRCCCLGPGFILRVRVVMMVVAMMVMASRKNRAGKHQQKQSRCKNLFHGTNVARRHRQSKRIQSSASREERAMGSGSKAEQTR
jgi:hypothetical protein